MEKKINEKIIKMEKGKKGKKIKVGNMKKIKIKPNKMQLQNSPKDLDEVARPSLFTERIGLFAGKSHNQVILHHVVHGISLHNDISVLLLETIFLLPRFVKKTLHF